MSRCDWASCHRPATRDDAGWGFCAEHFSEHRTVWHRSLSHLRNEDLTRIELLTELLKEYSRPVPPPRYRKIDTRPWGRGLALQVLHDRTAA